jgi:VWFA-related protein
MIGRLGRVLGFKRQTVAPILAALAMGVALAAAAASTLSPSAKELLVEALDAEGRPVARLSPEDLEVLVDGGSRPVLGLEPVHGEWRVVIFFDQILSEPRLIHNAALDLAELSDELVELGPVEVVLGAEEATTAVAPTREPRQLEQALSWLRIREGAEAKQLAARRRFIADYELEELVETRYSSVSATAGRRLASLTAGVREALADEKRALEEQRRQLLSWSLEYRPVGPAVLILVSGGSDEEGREFYSSLLGAVGMDEAVRGTARLAAEPSVESAGQALAALGWVTLAYAPQAPRDALLTTDDPAVPEGDEQVETVVQDGQEVERTVFTPRFDPLEALGRKGRKESEELPVASLLAPLESLRSLTGATGGELIADRGALPEALVRLDGRYRVRFADAERESNLGSVEVQWSESAKGGKRLPELRAPRWVSIGTPEILSGMRAQNLLEEGAEAGPLVLSAQIALADGAENQLTIQVEPADEGSFAAGPVPLRLSLATFDKEDLPAVSHQVLDSEAVLMLREEDGTTELRFTLSPLLRSDSPVAVVVEDLVSGLWGGTFATILGEAESAGIPLAGLLPAPRAVHLLAPAESMVLGPTLFETVHAGSVTRVDFFLDGELVASRRAPPFSVSVDLGQLPESHRVEAVAFDAGGREIGRDLLPINEGSGKFRVRIVRPRAEEVGSGGPAVVGSVEVQARVDTPRGNRLEKLEFYWNEELVATRFAPPFRQRIVVPSDNPKGFFRVVGTLDDGGTAEDVLFVNSPGESERLRVELVQLYAVVTGRDGRPLRGLTADRFQVFEEEVPQQIATFSEAGELPLTVGLAIDSSASMFVKLPDVQQAAAGFLRGLSERDRAFVVDFGSEPELHHDTSLDLKAVETALLKLRPDGRTAIWKGIVYALVQLQGVPGKKALIVYSDGADEDPEFSYRTSLRFARRVGVPVYIIVSNDEIYRTQGRGLTIRGFMGRLDTLTRAVGGRVFVTRVGENLTAIYSEIDEELRSQYVLGYYATDQASDRWRTVRVDVNEPGATARTVAGYFR